MCCNVDQRDKQQPMLSDKASFLIPPFVSANWQFANSVYVVPDVVTLVPSDRTQQAEITVIWAD